MKKRERRRKEGYRKLLDDGAVCVYCGCKGEVEDHALPYSLRNQPWARERVTVPSCKECNGMLSNSFQETLVERIAEAKERLRYRYSKVLAMPNWSTGELIDLGPGAIARSIIASMEHKKWLEKRLQFDYFLWESIGKPKSLLP